MTGCLCAGYLPWIKADTITVSISHEKTEAPKVNLLKVTTDQTQGPRALWAQWAHSDLRGP